MVSYCACVIVLFISTVLPCFMKTMPYHNVIADLAGTIFRSIVKKVQGIEKEIWTTCCYGAHLCCNHLPFVRLGFIFKMSFHLKSFKATYYRTWLDE